MQLSVPANFDPQLVARLAEYPVREVYGKFPTDFIGGGRPSYMGTPLPRRALVEYVRLLDDHGIAFNYLLNAACLGNREWSRRWQRKLHHLLGRLETMGVQALTVSTPYLLEVIKKRFPQFRVKVGIYAQVDTPRRARFWESLGADAINIESFSINRDFARLREIRAAVACDLQLIPNHPCLPNCPMQPYHQVGCAHASDGSGGLFIDYCFLRCSCERLKAPATYIKAGWIRPEDLGAYEKIGYTSFKLLERNTPSSDLLRRVKAYSERRFEGNLAELVLPYGFSTAPRKASCWTLRHFFRPLSASPRKLTRMMGVMRRQGMLHALETNPVVIDSRKLPPNFLDAFRTRDCAALDCAACGYCERVAAKAVRVDPEFRRRALEDYEGIDRMLIDGELWNAQYTRPGR